MFKLMNAPVPDAVSGLPDSVGALSGWSSATRMADQLFAGRPVLFYAAVGAVAVFSLFALWYLYKTFPRMRHEFMLWARSITGGAHRRKSLQYLGEEGIPIEMLSDSVGRRRPLCQVRVQYVRRDTVGLEVLVDKELKPSDKGKPVVCHFRPLRHVHIKFNCFHTYILGFEKKGPVRVVKVKMPVRTRKYKRRRWVRRKIRKQRVIMVRVWQGAGGFSDGGRFRFSNPAVKVNVENAGSSNRYVVDVSRGGLKIAVAKSLVNGGFEHGDEAFIEIKMFKPSTGNFEPWYFGANVAHVGIPRTGLMVMGFEFRSIGVKGEFGGEVSLENIGRSRLAKDFAHEIERLPTV